MDHFVPNDYIKVQKYPPSLPHYILQEAICDNEAKCQFVWVI